MSEPKWLHKDINHEEEKNVVTKPCPKKKKPVTALKSTRLFYFTSIEIFCQKWGI